MALRSLFRPLSVTQSVLASGSGSALPLFALFAFSGLAALSNFATQLLLARILGPVQFGAFSAALAIVTLMAPMVGFGLASWWLRVIGEEGYLAQRWIKPSFRFLLLSALFTIFLLIGWARFGPHDNYTAWLTIILTGVALSQAMTDLVSSKLQLEGKYYVLSLWQLTSHPLRLVGVLSLVFFLPIIQAYQAASVYLLISILVLALGSHQLIAFYFGRYQLAGHTRVRQINARLGNPDQATIKEIFFKTTPFGFEGLLFLVYYQADLVLIRYILGEESAGIYASATAVMAAVYIIPSVLYQKFFLTKIHRWSFTAPGRLKSFQKAGAFAMFLIGISIALSLWLSSPYFVSKIFGPNYLPAVSLIEILAFSIPFRFLSTHLACILSAHNRIWTSVKLTALTAFLNVLLNLVLIPEYGTAGAAFATVLTYIALALCFVLATSPQLYLSRVFK